MLSGSSSRPEQIALFTNSGTTLNGKIAVFHSIREEQIAGWTLWTTRNNDFFHSIHPKALLLFVFIVKYISKLSFY